MSNTLRMDNLQVMFYEDERRRMVIAEDVFDKSVHRSQKLFVFDGLNKCETTVCVPDPVDEFRTRADELLSSFQTSPPTQEDIHNAVSFLSVEHPMSLGDRSSREYVVMLVEIGDPDFESKYGLQWRDVLHSSADEEYGILLLEDIERMDVQFLQSTIVLISIKESPRAIKNALGRTMLACCFGTNDESFEFLFHLSCLRSIC
jgi:hypothetical protein